MPPRVSASSRRRPSLSTSGVASRDWARKSSLHDRRRDGRPRGGTPRTRIRRIDLYGASYGATAAQIYLASTRLGADDDLDSGSLLRVPLYEALAPNAESASEPSSPVRGQPACRQAFPGIRSELATLLERAARSVEAFGQTVTIDADAVASTVHALSLAEDGVPLIPDVVHRAAQGDYVPLAQEYVDRVGPGLDARARLAMSFEILCSEPWARFDPARVRQRERRQLPGRVAESRARLFAEPVGSCRRASSRPARTSRPHGRAVLILAGSADPQDPPANMRGWRTFFPKGRTVIVQGATHGVPRRAASRSSQRSRRQRNHSGLDTNLRAADRAADVRDP